MAFVCLFVSHWELYLLFDFTCILMIWNYLWITKCKSPNKFFFFWANSIIYLSWIWSSLNIVLLLDYYQNKLLKLKYFKTQIVILGICSTINWLISNNYKLQVCPCYLWVYFTTKLSQRVYHEITLLKISPRHIIGIYFLAGVCKW